MNNSTRKKNNIAYMRSLIENQINCCMEEADDAALTKEKNSAVEISLPNWKTLSLGKKEVRPLRLRGGSPAKSPMAECEEVMVQFDKILAEYRKALTPCGHIACNYAANISEATCQRSCYVDPENGRNTDGCGLPECEYSKYKSVLMSIDADIETQFIGPAIIGNCGHPKCPYKAQPTLPPIHWDCPEPLPPGRCTNPDCPYISNVMEYHSKLSSTKGPCGSDECPYVPPAPCSSPNCPFGNYPPCTAAKEAKMKHDNQLKNNNTKFASCPFSNPPTVINLMQFCENPNCDALKMSQLKDCGNRSALCKSPNCPYGNLTKSCSNPKCPFARSDTISACSNPDCPLNQESSESCANPSCPFATEHTSGSSETSINSSSSPTGSNPESIEEETEEPCANPACPFNISAVESCKNPECPFKEKVSQESRDSCDNPDCPFKQDSTPSGGSEESECECENPLCPSKRETCLNPNCPFNLRGFDTCTNPECPHRRYALGKDLGYCSTPSPSFNELCVDKTCPFYDATKQEPDHTGDFLGKSMTKIGNLIIEKGPLEFAVGDRPSIWDMEPCSTKTCKFMGATLECKDCSVSTEARRRGPCPKTCPGDPVCPLATERKLKRISKPRGISSRSSGPKYKKPKLECIQPYPGYKIGHRECVMPYFFVPPKMGWLWNIHTPWMNLKPRRGWRPGAITKTVAKVIMRHRKVQSDNQLDNNKKKKKKKNKDDSETQLICPKPTLEVKKREGAYFITMNPLKDPNTLEMNENPYMDVTPMQFKVEKNNLLEPDCVCTDEGESYKSDSSSNNEFDIEVTTPAGIIHPDRVVKKKDVIVKQTQYDRRDIPPSEKPSSHKKKRKAKGKKKKKKNKKGKK